MATVVGVVGEVVLISTVVASVGGVVVLMSTGKWWVCAMSLERGEVVHRVERALWWRRCGRGHLNSSDVAEGWELVWVEVAVVELGWVDGVVVELIWVEVAIVELV
jgi:hypothetical protein